MLNLDEFVVIKKEVNDYYYRYTVEAKDRQIEVDLLDKLYDDLNAKFFDNKL